MLSQVCHDDSAYDFGRIPKSLNLILIISRNLRPDSGTTKSLNPVTDLVKTNLIEETKAWS